MADVAPVWIHIADAVQAAREFIGIAKLLPACTTKVAEGMDIRTDTERLVRYRRMILELLMAERNHVCAVCVAWMVRLA